MKLPFFSKKKILDPKVQELSLTSDEQKKSSPDVVALLKKVALENNSAPLGKNWKLPLGELPPMPSPEEPLPNMGLFSSVQTKFSLISLGILCAVLQLLNIYPVNTTQRLLLNSKEASLSSQITMISSVLIELETLNSTTVQRVMATLDFTNLSRVIITDPVGTILYDSATRYQSSAQYALNQEIYLALSLHDVTNSHFASEAIYSSAASPIVYGDNTIGAIYLHEIDYVQGRLLSSLRDNLSLISWIAAVVAATLYLLFSNVFTNRFRAMLSAIRIVGAGDYGHRLMPKGKDEMSYLAVEFNILTDRLQTTEEVRRRFVSDASHELRTPLASIRLLGDSILHNEAIDPAMTREFVSDICTEAERLSRITERLLSLSKLDSLPAPVAEAVSTIAVIERILQNLELVAEDANIELRFFPEEDHYVLCTPDKLHQICYNLLENAVKYTPSGGFTQIATRVSGEEIFIEVTDNGLGIPTDDLPKIFNRFYRVDDARSREAGGTGLGLAIVRDTVRAYGGWVEARNNSPCGTIFTVGLPRTLPTSPKSPLPTDIANKEDYL